MACFPREKRYHWAILITIVALILLACGSWIYLTYFYIHAKCRETNTYWFISLSVTVIVVIAMSATTMLVVWVIYSTYSGDSNQAEGSQNVGSNETGKSSQQQPQQPQQQQILYGVPPPGSGIPAQVGALYKSVPQPADSQYQPIAYGAPIAPIVPYDHTGHPIRSPYYAAHAQMSPLPLMGSPGPSPSGHHQAMPAAKKSSGGGLKKVGSDESTGSTYYQQLMKTKGGVKSISQYGELLKAQRKTKTRKQTQDQK